MRTLPAKVRMVEVGPRDGLQNEAQILPAVVKIALIDRLAAAGLPVVEATSFVSAKWVPQMADGAEVMAGITRRPGTSYPVLVPNLRGFEAAMAAKAEEVAVFAAASESFSQRNINCSIAESLARFAPVMNAAQAAGVKVRGYVSCVLGCPYEGPVAPAKVAEVALRLAEMGCYEVSLGDTIGIGTPTQTKRIVEMFLAEFPAEKLALHLHDTRGTALANAYAALRMGVAQFDTTCGGLGGCPFAGHKGAAGNICTEDLVFLCDEMGIETGIDLERLIDAARLAEEIVGHPLPGSVKVGGTLDKLRASVH